MSLRRYATHESGAARTTRAMMVPWGLFSQHIGLIEELATGRIGHDWQFAVGHERAAPPLTKWLS
jgi:hypothetical protein